MGKGGTPIYTRIRGRARERLGGWTRPYFMRVTAVQPAKNEIGRGWEVGRVDVHLTALSFSATDDCHDL